MTLTGRLLQNLIQATPLFPQEPLTFPHITLLFLGFPPEVMLFLLYTHKYISCLDRLQFHLEHKHLQFYKGLYDPSGSGDPAYSRQIWLWIIVFQTYY